MIRGDSTDYDLLNKWSKDFDCQGYKTCEIGVREGLGSKIIFGSSTSQLKKVNKFS